jgi:hypothetical protein
LHLLHCPNSQPRPRRGLLLAPRSGSPSDLDSA